MRKTSICILAVVGAASLWIFGLVYSAGKQQARQGESILNGNEMELAAKELGSYYSSHEHRHPASLHEIDDPHFRPVSLDNWGTPFAVQYTEHGFCITSAGPDRRFDTADDIHKCWNWDDVK